MARLFAGLKEYESQQPWITPTKLFHKSLPYLLEYVKQCSTIPQGNRIWIFCHPDRKTGGQIRHQRWISTVPEASFYHLTILNGEKLASACPCTRLLSQFHCSRNSKCDCPVPYQESPQNLAPCQPSRRCICKLGGICCGGSKLVPDRIRLIPSGSAKYHP